MLNAVTSGAYSQYKNLCQQLRAEYDVRESQELSFLILEKLYGVGKADVLSDKGIKISEESQSKQASILNRLLKGEPMQYVFGEAEFCGMTLKVNENVLIPRPETEEMTEWLLSIIRNNQWLSPRVLDLCTGSGCIAISIKKAVEESDVTGIDISDGALLVAEENAKVQGTDISFVKDDVLSGLSVFIASNGKSSFDVIVSNPPYVCEREKTDMEDRVLDYEPSLALFVPDDDPLRFYREIIKISQSLLKPNGLIMMETNRLYAGRVGEMLETSSFRNIEIRKDIFGNDRMVKGEKI